jgi:PPK2 family polyphosphate:nucleotide phosphotransferase
VKKSWRKLVDRYRVTRGRRFRLGDVDPADTGGLKSELKQEAKTLLASGVERLAEYQDRLYAQDRWAVLLIFQAMDAAGKDGTIKHVMSGVNPQGCQVFSFKQPSAEELDHNFLWRCMKSLPERGRIGIFNRSYYEDVLIVKVHPELLDKQRLPDGKRGKSFWDARYDDINAFEQHLVRNGTVIVKFFLNVSKAEQKRRFLERLTDPSKNWKFSPSDVAERAHWDDYMDAYQDAINATSTEWAPWYVIPADHKWATRAVVADILTSTIRDLDARYPTLSEKQQAALSAAKATLESE